MENQQKFEFAGMDDWKHTQEDQECATEQPREGIEIVKFADTMHRLPVGVIDNGVLRKDFSLREMTYEIDEAIGRFIDSNPTGIRHHAMTVTRLIALLLEKVAGENFEFSAHDGEARVMDSIVRVGKLFFSDIFHIYLAIRVNELGPNIDVERECISQTCSYSGPSPIDLTTMDVTVINSKAMMRQSVDLLHPIRTSGGKEVRSVTIQPATWSSVISSDGIAAFSSAAINTTKLHLMRHSVVGINDGEDVRMLTGQEIKHMRKIDLERIANKTQDLNTGPLFILKGKCKACGTPFLHMVDWDYNTFFTVSSQ